MRKLYTQMAFVVVALAGMVSAGGQQMQPYTSGDGRFTVSFPQGEVQQSTDAIPYADGTKGTMFEFSVSLASGNIAYMVMYNDYSAAQANGDPQSVLAQRARRLSERQDAAVGYSDQSLWRPGAGVFLQG